VRRRTTSGGRFEAYQEFGRESSNSVFFQPNDQGTSQLTLSYSQPILRGAGRIYNSSLILLAQIDAGAARDEFSRQLQSQLLDVSEAYWSLFQQRSALMQKQRLLDRGRAILEDLEHRADVDALASQIIRARAAVATRRADLYRAETLVKNAESRIRSLVNAPYLGVADQFEMLPLDAPSVEFMPVSMSDALALAIRNRPELHQALKRIKAAAVRLNMSKNELLPVLDLVLETYVRGLRGDFDVGGAFEDSFKDGAPSYSAGFQMEFPLGNRAARATVRRRGIEMRQLQNQFRATIDVLQLEVEVVVREVQTAFREIKAVHEAMQAAAHEVDYLTKRWQLLSGEDRSAALILEDLLAAQDRLAIEELEFVQSQIVYNQSLTDLKQVTGTLLQMEQIEVHTTPGPDGNPVLLPVKFGAAPATIQR
jgi:outer membrane protein TolC